MLFAFLDISSASFVCIGKPKRARVVKQVNSFKKEGPLSPYSFYSASFVDSCTLDGICFSHQYANTRLMKMTGYEGFEVIMFRL